MSIDAPAVIEGNAEAVASTGGGHRLRRAVFARPSFGGLAGGLVFWWLSLSPSILPRSWTMQAAVSGVCLAIGYLIGTWIGQAVRLVLRGTHREVPVKARKVLWLVLAGLAALAVVVGFVVWPIWQNDQRELVELGSISWFTVVPMAIVSVVVAAILVVLGRLVGHGVASFDRFWGRRVPRLLAHFITFALVAVIFSIFANQVVADSFFAWANRSFGTFDDETPPGVVQPTSALQSGGSGSLVPWDTLGYEGRNFAGSASKVADLERFAGPGAQVKEPIRVYTGLKSADSAEERAALAVQELDRTGAADREVVAVVTVTGTGWVDPDAARTLETMHRGDTAIVAQQYSYLPSWISFLVDADKAADTGTALNQAVYEWWSKLPEGDRPKLIVFGLSLGSFGAEDGFAGSDANASLANMVERSDGVFLAGPTETNAVWRQLQKAREPGSPTWQPVFDDGRTVRWATRPSDLPIPISGWEPPRVLYFHHPSDPVGLFEFPTIWSRPEWTEAPTGFDVPDRVGWWPIVTWVQTVADLIAGFSTPPGHGHNYATDYVSGWAAVVPPDGWTEADSLRLSQFLGLE